MRRIPTSKVFIGIFIIFFIALVGYLILFFYLQKSDLLSSLSEKSGIQVVENTIGNSIEGRPIKSFTFGQGDKHLLFVGGIHGGYEWNSVLLANEFIDYFNSKNAYLPKDLKVTIIPVLNPDGLYEVIGKEGIFTIADIQTELPVGTGRFNANKVDLNRNFDCKWKSESAWRNISVSAGREPFSEPEARSLRDFILNNKIKAVIFWHSQSNAVYASECENGVLSETVDIMNSYANASGYKAIKTFDSYPISGDAEGWLASIQIPAITVELQSHESIEWERNLSGVNALFNYYNSFEI